MSYTTEQFEKHSEIIDQELKDFSSEERNDVKRQLRYVWPDDAKVKEMIAAKKTQISKRATPEELDEIFKYMR